MVSSAAEDIRYINAAKLCLDCLFAMVHKTVISPHYFCTEAKRATKNKRLLEFTLMEVDFF